MKFDFNAAKNELDAAISATSTEDQVDVATRLAKGFKDVIDRVVKADAVGSDLSTEKGQSKKVTDSEKDPAEKPKSTSSGYPDSAAYMKGDSEEYDEDEDEEEDEEEKPAFFKKMKKMKKMRKSLDEDDASELDENVDVTAFVQGIASAVESLSSDISMVKKALGTSLELQSDYANPAKDELLIHLAKGMKFMVEKVNRLEQALTEQNSMMKAVVTLPGVPRVSGMATTIAKSADSAPTSALNKSQTDRLWQAAASGKITMQQYREAKTSGDLSILEG